MKLWAYYYCGCIFESADALMSLHHTKVGAWKAMRTRMQHEAHKERDFAIQFGGKTMMRYKPLQYVRHSIGAVEVLP